MKLTIAASDIDMKRKLLANNYFVLSGALNQDGSRSGRKNSLKWTDFTKVICNSSYIIIRCMISKDICFNDTAKSGTDAFIDWIYFKTTPLSNIPIVLALITVNRRKHTWTHITRYVYVLNKPEYIFFSNVTCLSKRMFHMSTTTNTINNILFQQKKCWIYMTIKEI